MGFARTAHKPVRSSPGIGIMPRSWTRQASRTHPAPLSGRVNPPSAPRCKLCASARIARLSCRRYAASSAALAAASSSAARISIKSRAGQCCSFRYPGIQGFRSLGQHRRLGRRQVFIVSLSWARPKHNDVRPATSCSPVPYSRRSPLGRKSAQNKKECAWSPG